MTTATPTDHPTKGEITRQTILAAAIDRFGRDGFRGTSVADIARDAGVSGTAAYAYFANKEALFLDAVDHDTAEVIRKTIGSVFTTDESDGSTAHVVDSSWRESLIFTLVDELDDHPLAHRLLAGLEPEATTRVIGMPALEELRRICATRLRHEQAAGLVRTDLDTDAIGRGMVTMLLSLLMSVTQLGLAATVDYAADVIAVFDAALDPPATEA